VAVAERIFEDRRLALIYDHLHLGRGDLDPYAAMADEFGARSLLDIGCGTGTFACRMARRGLEVTGLDPAAASLDLARAKPGGDRVRWLHGEADSLPALQVDLVTMTANVAHVFLTDEEWHAVLSRAYAALRPGGRLVFETRDPARRAWLEWNRGTSQAHVDVPGIGGVTTWWELTGVRDCLVSIRRTFVFDAGDAVQTSDATFRYREREEVAGNLKTAGFLVEDIRDAPDRAGYELVFVARRPASAHPGPQPPAT
jgi:SAM-dependent methyltransferase